MGEMVEILSNQFNIFFVAKNKESSIKYAVYLNMEAY